MPIIVDGNVPTVDSNLKIGLKCSCNGKLDYGVVQCRTCAGGKSLSSCIADTSNNTQKIIQRQVRVSSNQFTNALASMNVLDNIQPLKKWHNVNWHQMSDRVIPSVQKIHYPGNNGNSTKTSITRMRPGSLSPGGEGLDIKHFSYDRYLNRIKGGNLKAGIPNPNITAIRGNKTVKFGLISGCRC
tara:strand:- start:22 stop:576 length:555 start_codon:yes stop_codon:yes gene_type:complete